MRRHEQRRMALEASGLRSLSPLMPVHHTHLSATHLRFRLVAPPPPIPHAPDAGLHSGRLSSGWLLEAIVLGPGETRRWSSRTTGRPSCGRPRERGGH